MHVCRLGCKKAQISNMSLEMKNMDLGLSKTVPGISLRPLERFLEVHEKIFEKAKIAKIMILAKIYETSKLHKKLLRGPSDIPGTVLES